MGVRVVIMTGDQRRHRHVAHRLQERFDVRGVVVEPSHAAGAAGSPEDAEVLTRHFALRDEAETRFFAGDGAWRIESARRLAVERGAANADAVFSWIMAREPEYLVLFGSSLIGERLLGAFPRRCVNLHLGLSPYYRGSGTNFWPLANREPELVGATIHLATAGIDAGPILTQVRPAMEPGDQSHDIGCRAILAGASALGESLAAYARGALMPVPQRDAGRFCRREEFTAEAVRRMWRHFETGIIAEYLADPGRVERYPLVEAVTVA